MIKLPQQDTKALLAIHGWSGILLGLLLYAVICTGVAAVFAAEINDWASPLPHTRTPTAFAPGLDAAVKKHATEVDPQFHEEVAIFSGAGGRLNIRYHRHETDPHGEPSERGVEYELDSAGWQTLERREGWAEEIEEQSRAGGVAEFLINLHVRLHIPDPYGLFVTGVLGLAMMIAAVTGFIVHRHLIADLFTLRLGRDALLRRRDLHVVAGSWNLPFALVLAFTGSFFSFASSVGLPAMAMVKFGGNVETLDETLYGSARPENLAPAATTNLDALLADTRRRTGAEPTFLSVSHYGRADATATLFTELPGDNLVYKSLIYDATNGAFIREQPPVGKIPSMGASLVGAMYPLHFGNFAGEASKSVWVALGFAAAYVSLTGMLLWTRRREEEPAWRRMARAVHYVGYGLPLALVVPPYAFFALRDSSIPSGQIQDIAFLIVAAAIGVVALAIENLDHLRRVLLACTGVGLLGLPVMRLLTGGPGWAQAWREGIGAVAAVDMALVVMGGLCLWAALHARRASSTATEARQIRSEAQAT